ncbi:hypothetical protein [Streptomyces virginiae]|uniref:hypothetical protein n=1 Tax=Streptomyces virginiae TaxID=1961 RepID=UPI00225B6FFB|nr:hypothetical protein [Streptomyces virginiae]MCX4719587.1 hypothetical protein [Streptomyces virginiae]MCX5271531.1 hypothetical protein [Streptomyces virginiae]
MRRGLLHAMAWMLATGAAVTLSWWGVHTVMSGTAYDPPLAVPLTSHPLSSSTHGAQASPSPSPSASPSPSESPTPQASPTAGPSPEKSSKPAAGPDPYRRPDGQEADAGKVQAYPVSGGRVVFSLGASSAELVSATPAAGWRMQVWKQDFWIRVTFTRDGREVSVFCTWHDHPPMVELVDP